MDLQAKWVRRFASGLWDLVKKAVGSRSNKGGYEMKMGVESGCGIWLRNGNFMILWSSGKEREVNKCWRVYGVWTWERYKAANEELKWRSQVTNPMI